jgi:HEAT repeat protein
MLAARALATHGGATYTEPILSNLDRFEQWGSEYVVSLLVSLGSGAEAGLRGVMEDPSRSSRTRALVTDALRRLHDLESVGAAEGILSREAESAREAEPDLVASLLRLLSVLGGPEHQDRVREFLDHSHFAVRAEAYSALGALGTSEDTERLEAGLSDPSPWVALHAARGMRERGRRPRLLKLSQSGSPGAAAAAQVLAEE